MSLVCVVLGCLPPLCVICLGFGVSVAGHQLPVFYVGESCFVFVAGSFFMCQGPDAFGCVQLPDAQVPSLCCPARSKCVMAGVLVGRDCQVPVQRCVMKRRRVPFSCGWKN